MTLRNLWTRPQVVVTFNGYTVMFTIRDIDRALELMNEIGEYKYGTKSGLDTSKTYPIDLYEGTKSVYTNDIQPLLKDGVGPFLISIGHANVLNPKHKPLKTIDVDIEGSEFSAEFVFINAYDPQTHKLLFSGKMKTAMYNKDMGIDYY